MDRKIANIDEFQMDENETPILPTGLREEKTFTSSPTGVTSPAGAYRTADGGSLIYEPSELSFFGQMLAQFKES